MRLKHRIQFFPQKILSAKIALYFKAKKLIVAALNLYTDIHSVFRNNLIKTNIIPEFYLASIVIHASRLQVITNKTILSLHFQHSADATRT